MCSASAATERWLGGAQSQLDSITVVVVVVGDDVISNVEAAAAAVR